MDNPKEEWGLPDWEDESSYGNIDGWNMQRWRWEFVRRHPAYRADYWRGAKDTHEYLLHMDSLYKPEGVPEPTDRNFISEPFDEENRYEHGYDGLPNPAYSEHPVERITMVRDNWEWRTINYDDACDACIYGKYSDVDSFLPSGYIAIRFDLTQSLEQQIAGLQQHLEDQRKFFFEIESNNSTPRTRIEKWPLYLRVLDARECGVSWNGISAILPESMSDTSPQAARNVFKQADDLRNKMLFNPQF